MMSLSVTWGKIDPRAARMAKMPPAQLRATGPSAPRRFVLCPSETHTASYAWMRTQTNPLSLSVSHTQVCILLILLSEMQMRIICMPSDKVDDVYVDVLGFICDLHQRVPSTEMGQLLWRWNFRRIIYSLRSKHYITAHSLFSRFSGTFAFCLIVIAAFDRAVWEQAVFWLSLNKRWRSPKNFYDGTLPAFVNTNKSHTISKPHKRSRRCFRRLLHFSKTVQIGL